MSEVKLLENCFENTLKIAQDVVIPKADDVIPALFQGSRTLFVRVNALGILTAVDLDHQFPFQRDEIDNESGKRNLPLEFDAIELTCAKSRPKKTFGFGRIRTERASNLLQMLSPLTQPSPHPNSDISEFGRGEGHFA